MGSSPKVTYNPPPPDNTFAKYLEYTKEQERRAEERAAQERAETKAAEDARKASGASAYSGLKQTTQQQLAQGLIGYESAANQLRDYAAKYDLTPPEADINELTQQYTAALPGKRATGISAAYEELLGRQASEEELGKAQERFQQGYYGSMTDFKDSLTKSQEYQKKFNDSYLKNYYDTKFGSSVADRTEEITDPTTGEKKTRVTELRRFKFDPSLLPTYAATAELEKKSGITQPDYETFFSKDRSVEELEQGIQGVRDTRQYIYSAGLTNLQGEIDKETQKLKNEGSKEVTKIGAAGSLYSNLVSGFWS
jgi:hypothetical protein